MRDDQHSDASSADPVRLRRAIREIQLYKPGKKSSAAAAGRRLALVASNEAAFPPLPGVVEAGSAAVARLGRYPDPAAIALRTAIARHHGVTLDQVAVGAGSMTLCHQAVLSTTDDGDELVYAWPSFEGYQLLSAIAGARPVRVPLADGGLDLRAMADAVTDRTRIVFVCNPNNPTGTLLPDAELAAFVREVPRDVLVIVDEAYLDFAGGTVRGGAELIADHANVAVMRTFSKAYGLAGVRVGYCLGAAPLVEAIQRSHLPFNVSVPAQAVAMAALEAGDELDRRVAFVRQERDRLVRVAADSGYPVQASHGNFVWLAVGEDAPALAADLESHGVIARPLPPFGVRITVGSEDDNRQVAEALVAVAATAQLAPGTTTAPR